MCHFMVHFFWAQMDKFTHLLSDLLKPSQVHMKYKQRILGLMGSTSNHACTTCKVHSNDRWNTTYEGDYYDSGEMVRDLQNDWKEGNFCHRKNRR